METENASDEVLELAPTQLERYYQNRVEKFEEERVDVEERLSRISETHEAIHKVWNNFIITVPNNLGIMMYVVTGAMGPTH